MMAGFECSMQRLRSGKRLNLTAATAHDCFADADYRLVQSYGIRAVRDGISWPEIESRPGHYDFTSALPLVRAARATGMQVIWDLFHYGYPDHLDVFAPEFPAHFARFAQAFARVVDGELEGAPFYTPVNEISFMSWVGGEQAHMNPFYTGRGDELKMQLVRISIAGIEAVWGVNPRARVMHPDPVIHVAPDPERPAEWLHAERTAIGQYEAWDMLAGRLCPQLGGKPAYLDIIGANFYPHNQWIHVAEPSLREPLPPRHPLYRPFRAILADVYLRYRRPVLVSETGAEGPKRVGWLRRIGREVRAAMRAGVPVQGITLYPIFDYPAWDDERCCPVGICGYAEADGRRPVYLPLVRELQRQNLAFEQFLATYQEPGVLPCTHPAVAITN
jgi:hypothetical protein